MNQESCAIRCVWKCPGNFFGKKGNKEGFLHQNLICRGTEIRRNRLVE